jgi:hypothetical protein
MAYFGATVREYSFLFCKIKREVVVAKKVSLVTVSGVEVGVDTSTAGV